MAHVALRTDERPVLEETATVYYTRFDSDENAHGTLFLVNSDQIVFVTRRLLVFGYERHHEYDLTQIMKVEAFSDGFKTHVLFRATDDEPEEVISYFYEIPGEDVDKWVEALARKAEEPVGVKSQPGQVTASPVIIREREVIKEIVKIRCSHCGNLYDQHENKCPHCTGH